MSSKRRKRVAPQAARRLESPPAVRIVDKRGRPHSLPDWKWRTFPVVMALSTGMVIGYFLGYSSGPSTRGTGFWIYVAVLGFFSICLSQFASRQISAAIMRRRLRARGLSDDGSRPPTSPR